MEVLIAQNLVVEGETFCQLTIRTAVQRIAGQSEKPRGDIWLWRMSKVISLLSNTIKYKHQCCQQIQTQNEQINGEGQSTGVKIT